MYELHEEPDEVHLQTIYRLEQNDQDLAEVGCYPGPEALG